MPVSVYTISQLITLLQTELDKNGDIPVQFCSDSGGWINDLLLYPSIYTRHKSEYKNGKIGDISNPDFFKGSKSALQIGFDIRTY